jgi:hypothetical protein
VVSPARYFIPAAIVLLLGAAALPTGLSAYDAARHDSDALNVAVGIYGSFVLVIAIIGPIEFAREQCNSGMPSDSSQAIGSWTGLTPGP